MTSPRHQALLEKFAAKAAQAKAMGQDTMTVAVPRNQVQKARAQGGGLGDRMLVLEGGTFADGLKVPHVVGYPKRLRFGPFGKCDVEVEVRTSDVLEWCLAVTRFKPAEELQ